MGVVLAFVVGYLVGTRAGQQGYEELSASVQAVSNSEEFRGLLSAVRSHLSSTLEELSRAVAEEGRGGGSVTGMVTRVRQLFEAPTSAAAAGSAPAPPGP